jgi:hypothetical protein
MTFSTKQVQDFQDKICLDLANGESLLSICRADDMAGYSTVMEWLGNEKYKHFAESYARARDINTELSFEGMQEIADTCEGDSESIAKAKLRIETTKWTLGRLNAPKYGDSRHIDVSGSLNVNNTIMGILGGDADTETS